MKFKIIVGALLVLIYPTLAQDPAQVDIDYDSPADAMRIIRALDTELRIIAKRDYANDQTDIDYTPVTKIIDDISDPHMLFVLAVTFDQLLYPYYGLPLANEDDERGQIDEEIRAKLCFSQFVVVDYSIKRLKELKQTGSKDSELLLELLQKIVKRMTIPV